MAQFLNSLNEVRKNYSKYDKWEQEQANERAQKEHLAATLNIPQDQLELTKKRAETVVRATEIMDARSEDNCQNVEQLTGILSMFPILGIQLGTQPVINLITKKAQGKIDKQIKQLEKEALTKDKIDLLDSLHNKKYRIGSKIRKYGTFISLGAMFAAAIGTIIWANSQQKQASRIGRYQAKHNELKGLENFVVYTPEQLEKAKEIAKNIPDEKEKNSLMKAISELKGVAKDKKAYKQWLAQKDPKELEKLKQVQLSPEQLKLAEADKELIVDTVKEINIQAEEYSENVENAFDTFESLSWIAAIPLGFGINKIMKALKTAPKYRALISAAIPTMTALGISLTGTLEEKNASRIGRYKARKDILKNPARLMAFSKEDMEKVKDIKADKQKQTFWQRLGSSFKFLGTYLKDKKEYKNYKKTTQKENEKLQKAFKQIKTTDAQKAEARNLQKNVFRTFDEVDEMSQRLSEDTEAGTEIAKELGTTAWTLGGILGMGYLAMAFMKGKLPIAKWANKLTNITFDAKSPLKKAINNLHDVLQSQGKDKVKEFQRALAKKDLKYFLSRPENQAIKEAIEPLAEEFAKLGSKGIVEGAASGKTINEIISTALQPHFKQTRLAKWTRNMLTQCTKLWAKVKASKSGQEIPKEIQEQLGMNFTYKNYSTLINTGAVAGIPILGVLFGVPYAFNSWLTSIQKKAGKIGIMKAMEKVDDPRVFANQEQQQEQTKETNLIKKTKQQAK